MTEALAECHVYSGQNNIIVLMPPATQLTLYPCSLAYATRLVGNPKGNTRLPGYKRLDDGIYAIENRFYVYLTDSKATPTQRKLTARVTADGKPLAGIPLHWSIDGKSDAKFLNKAGKPVDQLTDCDTKTDKEGLFEITLTHPPKLPSPLQRNLTVRARTTDGKFTATLTLALQ
ncbi:MAG: Ig-like domain-containing protein, partial [Gammaproteobacteria bacterium]|nr:Ig-like domain-containing protein [Gammaproteobacteria bacterium]